MARKSDTASETAAPTIHFFATPDEWRRWLAKHHATEKELWVGFYKKGSGKPSITWPESVDGALCFGWIDGLRKGIDETSYKIRFTPRKPRSIWSSVNIRRAAALEAEGLMTPAGRAALAARTAERSEVYAYEQPGERVLSPDDEARFRANAAAWTYFESRPASYRRSAIWWVISAKQATTHERRLATLIADSAAGRTLKHLTRP
jgi:uncharacterized protein YdeI (YjbR/CyaY-like superfamily)